MDEVRILLYHSVGKVDPRDKLGIRIDKSTFLKQTMFLKNNGYNVWTLKDAADSIKEKKPIPHKTIVITFDDGYEDNLINAAPLMEGLGFYATFFITVDYIGTVKTSPRRDWQHWKCMDAKEINTLIRRGHDIGSHGLHHVDITKLNERARAEEIRNSKRVISSLLNKDVNLFSYPYGCFDGRLMNMLTDEGYKAACTTTPGANRGPEDLYKLKRIEVLNSDTLEDFKKKIGHDAKSDLLL